MILNGLPQIANVKHCEPTCFDLVSRRLETCCLHSCLFDGCRNSPSCKYLCLDFGLSVGMSGNIHCFPVSGFNGPTLTWSSWRHLRAAEEKTPDSINQTQIIVPVLPFPPCRVAVKIGGRVKTPLLKTRPMPRSLVMVQIKGGPIHLGHKQSHLAVHHDHIVRVLAKPFANLFIFFLQENKERRALIQGAFFWLVHPKND